MRLYNRQKLLLSMLHAAGGHLDSTDMQKLLFLYTSEWEVDPSFRFIPHHYGCFSFQANADRDTLIFKNCLETGEQGGWNLQSGVLSGLGAEVDRRLHRFVNVAVPERGDALIRRVYRDHPYFAIRSTILDRIYPSGAERNAIAKAIPKSKGRALFTIGYEGDSIDGYLNRLIQNNVRLLCDVRKNPLSRKTGFSKRQLAAYCEKVSIEYKHLPELGIPGSRRRTLETQADYNALFEEYEREDLPMAGEAIQELMRFLKKYNRIALTCFEKEHECCHRHCVAEEMQRRFKTCPEPQHI